MLKKVQTKELSAKATAKIKGQKLEGEVITYGRKQLTDVAKERNQNGRTYSKVGDEFANELHVQPIVTAKDGLS